MTVVEPRSHLMLALSKSSVARCDDAVTQKPGVGAVSSLILRLERLEPAPVVDLDRPRPRVAEPTAAAQTALGRWSAAAAAAQDACVVLDPQGRVVSLSAAAAELLDCSDVGVIGRRLTDITTLIDFDTGATVPEYQPRIPPLAALSGDGLVRSLMRVRRGDGMRVTIDAAATPLRSADGIVVGSLTFFAPIPH